MDNQHDEETKLLMKAAFKAAAKEYMEESVTIFGWWSLRALGGVIVIGLLYFLLSVMGWHK